MTEDPIKDGLNWYSYCDNNPINRWDPSGLEYEGYTAKELLELLNSKREAYRNQMENAPDNKSKLNKLHCQANFIRSAIKATVEYNGDNDEHKEFRALVDECFSNPDGQTDSQMNELIAKASGFLKDKATQFDIASINSNRGITKSFVNSTLTETICFTEDTLVLSKNGNIPIKNIKIGDLVYSKNENTNEVGLKKVINVFENETDVLIHIKVNGEVIKATPSHPFWVNGIGWTSAKELKKGSELLDDNGNIILIEDVYTEFYAEKIKVYNFEVEDWHTYFVGKNNLWVHNTCNFFAGPITEQGALNAAERWLGDGYVEIASGVYLSADGTRGFRMSSRDLEGHGDLSAHVHFTYQVSPKSKHPTENSHVYIEDERKRYGK